MSTILYDCQVTEYAIAPKRDNEENSFCLHDNCLVINFMNISEDKIMMQSEISKDSAIELAKLILLKYNQQHHETNN